jgi:hypothetical protein
MHASAGAWVSACQQSQYTSTHRDAPSTSYSRRLSDENLRQGWVGANDFTCRSPTYMPVHSGTPTQHAMHGRACCVPPSEGCLTSSRLAPPTLTHTPPSSPPGGACSTCPMRCVGSSRIRVSEAQQAARARGAGGGHLSLLHPTPGCWRRRRLPPLPLVRVMVMPMVVRRRRDSMRLPLPGLLGSKAGGAPLALAMDAHQGLI